MGALPQQEAQQAGRMVGPGEWGLSAVWSPGRALERARGHLDRA